MTERISQNRRRVYVAGPITHGDRLANVAQAMAAGRRLLAAGFAPFLPHLSVYWDAFHPQDYETWMEVDLAWLAKADAILRLPGYSPGADREVKFAREHGIPAFARVEEIEHYFSLPRTSYAL